MIQPDGPSKLRVCASMLREKRNREVLRRARIIVLEHVLPTTAELLRLLQEAGGTIHALVAKPYSIDPEALAEIAARDIAVVQKSYADLEATSILPDMLTEAVAECRRDGSRLVILEVGGYFARPLSNLNAETAPQVAGVVEDTTFGHNRYLDLVSSLRVPVISVARSRLKEIEAHFVGHDAVQAADVALRSLGVSLTGRQALVIGYGMIGKNVAQALRAADLNVSVYDIRDHRNLTAYMRGFGVDKKAALLRKADIVFAATGWATSRAVVDDSGHKRAHAVSRKELLECLQHNTVLASVGSQDIEFDLEGLRELATAPPESIGPHLQKYALPDGDTAYLLARGTAVNFLLPSIPIEVLDLVFAEMLLAALHLLKTPEAYSIGKVHEVSEKAISSIAFDWLRFNNPKR